MLLRIIVNSKSNKNADYSHLDQIICVLAFFTVIFGASLKLVASYAGTESRHESTVNQ